MTHRPDKPLASCYEGLAGASLIHEFGRLGESVILEAFWRYRNAAVAADVAPAIILSGDTYLLGLVLDEILSPSLGAPLPQAIANALNERRPQLAGAEAARLIERLLDRTSLHHDYEPARSALEMWALEQAGELGENFAIAVISRQTPMSGHGNVRDSAYLRCQASARVLNEAAQIVAAALERSPSATTWQQAADFIEQACRNTTGSPAAVVLMIKKLIDFAPQCSPQDTFGPELRRLAASVTIDELEKVVDRESSESPGGRAIVRTVPEVRSPARRARLFAMIVRSQPALWGVLEQVMQQWDEAEWRRVLRSLVGAAPIHRQALSYLVPAAPIQLTRELTALVMSQVSAEDELIRDVGAKLGQRLADIGESEDTRDGWVTAVHWPKARDAAALAKFAAVISCVEDNLRTGILVRGFLTGKLPAKPAAELVSDDQVARALAIVAAGQRGKWAAALATAHPNGIGGAVNELVAAGKYPTDVVAALAPSHPDIAFGAVAARWPGLDAADKDALIGLLEEHSSDRNREALEAIVRDEHRDNAKRRARAVRRLAELVVPGAAVPDSVIALLDSNLSDLREAAVQVIESIKPREPQSDFKAARGRGASRRGRKGRGQCARRAGPRVPQRHGDRNDEGATSRGDAASRGGRPSGRAPTSFRPPWSRRGLGQRRRAPGCGGGDPRGGGAHQGGQH